MRRGGGRAGVTTRTDGSEYRPGQVIIVTTVNRSDGVVYDDHCGGEVQGFELLGEWNASYGVGRGCLDVDPADWRARSIPIPRGSLHADTFHVNGLAYTGTWRVRLDLRDAGGELLPDSRSVSNTFHVKGAWSP
jgi:hypothetical protein